MRYQEKESLLHLYAKQTLHKWLLEAQEPNNDGGILKPFSWRLNYGIFMELPFYETSDPYYFEQSKGLIDYEPIEIDYTKPYEQIRCQDQEAKTRFNGLTKQLTGGKFYLYLTLPYFTKARQSI